MICCMTIFESVHKCIESNTKSKLFPNVTFIRDEVKAACNSNFGIVSNFSLSGINLALPDINSQVIEFDDMNLR